MTSNLLFGQVCDTIDGQIMNCANSKGFKQGYWKERRKILYMSSDSDFGPETGHKDYYRYLVLSEGNYSDSKKTGTWTYYIDFNNEQGEVEKQITYLDNGNCIEEHFNYRYRIEYNADTSIVSGQVYLKHDTVQIKTLEQNIVFMTSTGVEILSFAKNEFQYELFKLVNGIYNREIFLIKQNAR